MVLAVSRLGDVRCCSLVAIALLEFYMQSFMSQCLADDSFVSLAGLCVRRLQAICFFFFPTPAMSFLN